MEIEVFDLEVNDGLQKTIANNMTKAEVSIKSFRKIDSPSKEISDVVKKASANANLNQMDLYYLETVLVSTGWNANDDVFLPEDTYAARNTPEDKPFNLMHDDDQIIGHITKSYVEDFDGNLIPEGTPFDQIPANFNIITEAVIYTKRSDQKLQAQIDDIVNSIDSGSDKWKVSMECFFAGFDYAAINEETGEATLIPRNSASASLTKHLRVYGGTGSFQGYKIGRALRGQTFSGKGLVDNPANKRSVIRNGSHDGTFATTFTINDTTCDWFVTNATTTTGIGTSLNTENIQENNMSTELEKQVAEYKELLAQAEKDKEKMKKEMEDKKDKESQAQKEALESAVSAKDEDIKVLSEQVKTVQANLDKVTKERDEAQAKISELEKSQKAQSRKAELSKAGVSDSELEAEYTKLEKASDEVFATVLSYIAQSKAEEGSDEDVSTALENVEKDETSTVAVNVDTETVEQDAAAGLRKTLASHFAKSNLKFK